MYYFLLNGMKNRLITELQHSFTKHPVYEKVVPYIQNKYSFAQRPQFGIVLKGASASQVQLSADHFMGTVVSHVMLAYPGVPAYPIEWVREDTACVEKHGHMPTPPGVYYLEILNVPTNTSEVGNYIIDPLITVTDEPVLKIVSGIETEAVLKHNALPKTLRLWQNRNYLLQQGVDYQLNGKNITFITRFTPGSYVTADYRYPGASIGPVPFQWNSSDSKTLEGVVMAFGKRARQGDKVAIVVYPDRVDAAQAYGGRYDISFDLDIIAQDPIQAEEMADYITISLWGEKRRNLSSDGIELTTVSIGGESEEVYDEAADKYTYMVSLSLQFQVEWEIHLPLSLTISKVSPTTNTQNTQNIFFQTSPIFVNRNNNYERIL